MVVYSMDSTQLSMISVLLFGLKINVGSIYCAPSYSIKKGRFYDHIWRNWRPIADGLWFRCEKYLLEIYNHHPERQRVSQSNKKYWVSCCNTKLWPTDINNSPDIVGFFMVNIFLNYLQITNEKEELSSDHSPLVMRIIRNRRGVGVLADSQ